MEEIWKDIDELHGHYQISNMGNTRRKERLRKGNAPYYIPAKTAKQQNNGHGYLQLYVCVDRIRNMYYVHRLVAKYFLERVEGKNLINHKDSNRSNNNVNNLEWCTYSENALHASKFGNAKKGELSHFSKLNTQKVLALRRLYKINPLFNKLKIAQKIGVSDSVIHAVIKRRTWKHI